MRDAGRGVQLWVATLSIVLPIRLVISITDIAGHKAGGESMQKRACSNGHSDYPAPPNLRMRTACQAHDITFYTNSKPP